MINLGHNWLYVNEYINVLLEEILLLAGYLFGEHQLWREILGLQGLGLTWGFLRWSALAPFRLKKNENQHKNGQSYAYFEHGQK